MSVGAWERTQEVRPAGLGFSGKCEITWAGHSPVLRGPRTPWQAVRGGSTLWSSPGTHPFLV